MMTAGQLIKHSIAIYKQHITRFISLMMVVFIPYCIAAFVSIGLYFAGFDGLSVRIIRTILLASVNIITFTITMALIVDIRAAVEGSPKKPVLTQAKEAFRFFFPALWVFFLSFLVIAGASLFLIIPGIIVGVIYSFAIYALVIDEQHGIQALKTSHHLVKGRWWQVLWLLVAPAFVFGILFLFVNSGVSVLSGLVLGSLTGNIRLFFTLLLAILTVAISLILSPLPSTAMVILYEYLKLPSKK